MTSSFIAYPANPPEIGKTIRDAVELIGDERPGHSCKGWEQSDNAGQFIIDPIFAEIAGTDFLTADITRLNFNVTYEIGFTIGKKRRIVLVRNISLTGDDALVREVGIFDTLTYQGYSSARELMELVTGVTKLTPLPLGENDVNLKSPIYVVLPRSRTDIETDLISRIKKAFRAPYRSYDPQEDGRLPGPDAIRHVSISHGVVVPLLPQTRKDAQVHNLRAAFVAGLAHGMGKELLLLQYGEDPVPLDYRDFVRYVGNDHALETYFGDFAPEVFGRYQAEVSRHAPVPTTKLQQLKLGCSSAENEIGDLGGYYLHTEEYNKAARGESRIVTGRKGSGKTALFFRLRDAIRQYKANVVLDLRPEGFQLVKLKDVILQYLESGTKEHTITAFWEYLFLLEICHKVLQTDRDLHLRDHNLYEPYHALLTAYGTDDYVSERDFAERLSKLMQRIIRELKEVIGTGEWKARLSSSELTNILYRHDTKLLRDQVTSYLEKKRSLWILFDNIDKGWPATGLSNEDALIIRCLMDALEKLQRAFRKRNIESHGIVFLRNDVYELLIENTSDRGKTAKSMLDWTDPDMLREVLRLRLVTNEAVPNTTFDNIWQQFCTSHVGAEDSSTYVINRCLMRPRSLIDFLQYCRSHAINLGHTRIDEDDIRKGEEWYSTELIANIGFELRDVFSDAGDVLYEFLGANKKLSYNDVAERLKAGKIDDANVEKMIDLLLWYGFLGVIRDSGEIAYIYTVTYDRKRLKALLKKGPNAQAFYINPAFWVGLEIV